MRTKLAVLIGKMEGFGIPNSVPTRDHNPGDLRHSPHSQHAPDSPNGIGMIDTDADGWADLERQLRLYADRGMTLGECIAVYAPASENDSTGYAKFISEGLRLGLETSMTEVLKISADEI